jgi:tetratricopeptide (TPR) repeat protein
MMLSIPFPRNPRYVGNGEVIHALTDVWKQKRGGGQRVPVAFLRGLGGIGKTQTATEFAYSVSGEASIIWMRASGAQTLQSEFSTLAKALGCDSSDPDTVQRFIKHWLQTTDMVPWLLVLDNADDMSFIGPYLPTYGDGMVVITTRDSSAGVGDSLSCAIQPLQEHHAVSLLLADAGSSADSVSPQQQDEARVIVELMGYLPLAIEQASSYIRERQCTLTHYRSLLNQRFLRRKLVSRAPNVLHSYPNSLNSTVCAGLEAIREKSPAASSLLRLLAFVDAQDIDLALLRDGIVMDKQYMKTSGFFFDDFDFDEALALLLSYSIITRKNDGQSLWMHVLVQDIIIDTAEDDEYWNTLRSGAKFLHKLTPASAEEESWPRLTAVRKHVQKLEEVFRPVIPKLWEAIGKDENEIKEDAQQFCAVFWRVGYFLRNRAEEDSISLMSIAREIRRHTNGELDPEFLAMKRHVGSILVNQSSRDSIRILGECVTAGKQILDQREASGDKDGAIEALLDLGKSRVRYAIALSDLGGDLQTSLQVCQNQVSEEEKLLPKEHPQAIITRLMFAYYLFMIDEFERAVVELDWAHTYYQSALGDGDSLTFRTASNLACVLAILQRDDEADKHFQTCLRNAELVSQGHYFYEARINYNIGVHHYQRGHLAEADASFNRTLDIEKEIFSSANGDHMEQHTTREMQALVHLAQGKYASACELLESALDHSIRVGTKDRRKIRMMNNLAQVYDAAGRPADAARMLERRNEFKETPEGTPAHFQEGLFVNYLFHYVLGKGFE